MENYIIQSLIPQFEVSLKYWSDNIYEVDFIIQSENDVFPIEDTKSRSLLNLKKSIQKM